MRQYDYILKLETVNAEAPLMAKNLKISRKDYGNLIYPNSLDYVATIFEVFEYFPRISKEASSSRFQLI